MGASLHSADVGTGPGSAQGGDLRRTPRGAPLPGLSPKLSPGAPSSNPPQDGPRGRPEASLRVMCCDRE